MGYLIDLKTDVMMMEGDLKGILSSRARRLIKAEIDKCKKEIEELEES